MTVQVAFETFQLLNRDVKAQKSVIRCSKAAHLTLAGKCLSQ